LGFTTACYFPSLSNSSAVDWNLIFSIQVLLGI
jgi:hypothetical protein